MEEYLIYMCVPGCEIPTPLTVMADSVELVDGSLCCYQDGRLAIAFSEHNWHQIIRKNAHALPSLDDSRVD